MKKAKILVVEDERIVALDIKNRLESLGYIVCAIVSSGEEAIQKTLQTQPDLVLMDIMLKGDLDGVEVTQQIRNRYEIPVVYLTAYADENTLQRVKITEPAGYILKPFQEKELRTTIEMALYKHEMEKKLKESKQWFVTTLESIGDAVIATNREGIVIFMNPVAEALTGWSQEEAAGRDLAEIFKIINEQTRVPAKSPVEKVLREGIVAHLANHTLLINKKGREIPIDDSAAPIKNKKGYIIGVVLVFRQVNKREIIE